VDASGLRHQNAFGKLATEQILPQPQHSTAQHSTIIIMTSTAALQTA